MRTCHTRGASLRLALGGLLLLALGATAGAQGVPGAERTAKVEWDLRLGFDLRYDDNILQLSDRHIECLENPQSCSAAPDRFSIETPDDVISIPRLSSALEVNWLDGRPTRFDVDISAFEYLNNSIKSYQSYRVSVRQPLHRGKLHPTSIEASWERVPDFYLRNLISDRASEEQGMVGVRKEATYRRTTAQVEVEQEIVTDRLRFTALAGSELRDYNRFFDERDSRMPFRDARLSWDPLGDGRLRLRASYRREDLHAGGDLSDTLFFTEDDISSRRDIMAADARWRWGEGGRRKSVRLSYEIEARDYSTTDPPDIYHFGREDSRRDAGIAFQADLKKGWFFTAQAGRLRARTEFPTTTGSTFEPNDVTDYTNDTLSVGFGYEFDLAPRK